MATLDGIVSAAREHEYAITMIEKARTMASACRTFHRMSNLPVDGMIISMSLMASDFKSFVPQPGPEQCFLPCTSTLTVQPLTQISNGCSKLVIDHLYELGHRKIRFVAGPSYIY